MGATEEDDTLATTTALETGSGAGLGVGAGVGVGATEADEVFTRFALEAGTGVGTGAAAEDETSNAEDAAREESTAWETTGVTPDD